MPPGNRPGWLRLAECQRDHPHWEITPVKGLWRAWIPDAPDSLTGTELRPERHLGDLLDRLEEMTGPG